MAGGKDPAFPLYAADWLTDDRLAVASLEELGALVCLWSFLWLHGPQSMDRLRAASHVFRATPDEAESLAREWLTEGDDGRWFSKRLEAEREERRQIRRQRSEAGKRSAVQRDRQRDTQRESNGAPNETGNGNATGPATKVQPPSPSPSTSENPPPTPPTPLSSRAGSVPQGVGGSGVVVSGKRKKGRMGPRSAGSILDDIGGGS
jgi:uncharacterized protein YdaU (DUF1376 family)